MNGTFMVNSINKDNLGKIYPFGVEVTKSPLSKHSKNSGPSPKHEEEGGREVTASSPEYLVHRQHHRIPAPGDHVSDEKSKAAG